MSLRYLVPGLPFGLRLALFALLEAAGMALQVLPPGRFWAGTLVMVGGLFLLFARGYRNKPADLGLEDWKPVSAAELARIRDNLERTRAIRLPLPWRRGFPFLVLLALFALAGALLVAGWTAGLLPVFDAFLLLVPLLFSGRVRLWTPQELKMKLFAFQPIVEQAGAGGPVILTPYLRFDRDREGRQIPEDVRLMVEPRRKSADFLGVQLQVAINNGPTGAVPYLYAVFLCRGKGASFARFSAGQARGMVREPGGDGDYGWVVLRQKTSGKGYHTTPQDCARLFRMVLDELQAPDRAPERS